MLSEDDLYLFNEGSHFRLSFHGRFSSLNLTLPPLGIMFFKWAG